MFKEGRFYAIQGRDVKGQIQYLDSSINDYAATLRALAMSRKRSTSGYGRSGYEEESDSDYKAKIISESDPFNAKLWAMDTKIKTILDTMRNIRKNAHDVNVDPNSLRIVIVESNIQVFIPESPSEEETELRKFVLDKLSDDEKKLLNVTHWEVYGKLADRSMMNNEDEDDEG